MICKKCQKAMHIGQVIDPFRPENAFVDPAPAPINNDTLVMKDCWKCPTCGHSEWLE